MNLNPVASLDGVADLDLVLCRLDGRRVDTLCDFISSEKRCHHTVSR